MLTQLTFVTSMPSTRWIIAPNDTDPHQWFPRLCDVQNSSLDISNPQRVMRGWKGPFLVDSVVACLWRVRKWRLQISAVRDAGGGSTTTISEDRVIDTYCAYNNSTNPTDVPLADESWLNYDDLAERETRVVATNYEFSWLHPDVAIQNAGAPFYPEGQVHYNTGTSGGTLGYYLNALFLIFDGDFDFISSTGVLPSSRESIGITLSWDIGGESLNLTASRSTPSPPDGVTYSGSVYLFPEEYWAYEGPLGPTFDTTDGTQLVNPKLNHPIQNA